MKKIVFIAACLFSSLVLARGEATSFDVNHVRIDKSGTGYVEFVSPLVAQGGTLPTCGSLYPKALAFDTNTAGGKAIFALALAAKASGDKIFARGTNDCTIYPDTMEDWAYGW